VKNNGEECYSDQAAFEKEIDLRVYIKVLKKRRVLIAAITLIAVLASGFLSYFMIKPVYQANSILLVTQAADKPQMIAQKDDLSAIVNSVARIPVLTMNTYVGQIKSEALMQRVIDKLQLGDRGYKASSLAGQIKATAAKDSYLIDITVTNNDPQLAADIANTLVHEFMGTMTEKNQEQMDQSVKFLEQKMIQVRNDIEKTTDSAERARLQSMLTLLSEGITRTQIARSIDLGSTSLMVVSPAAAHNSPVKPNKKLNITVAFLLGLMASVALSFVLEFLDYTIKTTDDVSQYLDLPVVGLIPVADNRARAY
jgi:capsular polysaccharide biosynthesis protein